MLLRKDVINHSGLVKGNVQQKRCRQEDCSMRYRPRHAHLAFHREMCSKLKTSCFLFFYVESVT